MSALLCAVNKGFGTLVECNRPGVFKASLRALGIACGNGIDTVREQPSAGRRFQTRTGKTDGV